MAPNRQTTTVFFVVFILTITVNVSISMAIEKAQYKTIVQEGRFELRQYEPHIVAETYVEGSFSGAVDAAFNRLFRYIQGNNRKRESISMTAPVNQEADSEKIAMTAPVGQQEENGMWRITFLMPSSYTMDTLPQPLDSSVLLRQEDGRLIAALRYSGDWSEKRFRDKEKELFELIKKHDLTPSGETIFARYNPPFLPPFLRRNEVHIPVEMIAAQE
jgi:hypothetical protein